jgi:cell division protein FtsB
MNDEQLPAAPRKRRRVRNILAVAAAVVVVGALAGIATIALLRNATLSSQVTVADARAANAVSAAQAAAQKDYTARNAALNREAVTLNGKNQAIAAEIGELQANTIRADGMYVVGHDIKSGTWHSVGDGRVSGALCRFVVVDSANRSNNLPSIYFDGPWTINLSGAYAFEIHGPCTWIRVP